jgi:hypothetical protein
MFSGMALFVAGGDVFNTTQQEIPDKNPINTIIYSETWEVRTPFGFRPSG